MCGTTNDGRPARTTSWVVPTEPWWTTAAIRGSSAANGSRSATIRTPSATVAGGAAGGSTCTIARQPAAATAATIASVRPTTSGIVPKVTSSAGPAATNASTAGGSGAGAGGASQPPVTRTVGDGPGGTRCGEQAASVSSGDASRNTRTRRSRPQASPTSAPTSASIAWYHGSAFAGSGGGRDA